MDPNNHMTKPGDLSFSIVDPDWLIKIKETDDSEYQPTPEPAPVPFDSEQPVDWDYTQVGQLATFIIGALCSSIIWFALLLWLVEL